MWPTSAVGLCNLPALRAATPPNQIHTFIPSERMRKDVCLSENSGRDLGREISPTPRPRRACVRYLFLSSEGILRLFCRWAAFPNQIRATLLRNRPKNVMDDGPTSVSLGTLAVRARYRRTDKRRACAKSALSVSVAKGWSLTLRVLRVAQL